MSRDSKGGQRPTFRPRPHDWRRMGRTEGVSLNLDKEPRACYAIIEVGYMANHNHIDMGVFSKSDLEDRNGSDSSDRYRS